jgi:hypothetical protein
MKKLLYLLAFGLANTFSSQASAQGVNNVGGAGGAALSSSLGSELESTRMAVQQNRVNLLDEQLKREQHNGQAKIANIAALNTQLDALTLAKGKTTDPQTIAKLDVQKNGLTAQIDALRGSQQSDLLRLQSLSNKRDEARGIMNNTIKKLADERPGIIGPTR